MIFAKHLVRAFSALLILGAVVSAQAEFEFRTYEFPGYMKIVVEPAHQQVAQVDYLFVVDNSGSMSSHQQNLARHIDTLIKALTDSKVDFHAAVISTDSETTSGSPRVEMGEFLGSPRVVTMQTPNALDLLKRNLLLGTNGSGTEEMFAPLQKALSEPLLSGKNSGFLRTNAGLSVIVLSDAEDQGKMLATEIFTFLAGLKSVHGLVKVDGILAHSGTDSNLCNRDDVNVPPLKIEELIKLSGGELFSICDADLSGAMEKIGRRNWPLVDAWVKRIPMMVVPKMDSIKVTYGTQTILPGDIKRGWTYDYLTNEILLGDEIEWSVQPPDTTLDVTFVPLAWAK